MVGYNLWRHSGVIPTSPIQCLVAIFHTQYLRRVPFSCTEYNYTYLGNWTKISHMKINISIADNYEQWDYNSVHKYLLMNYVLLSEIYSCWVGTCGGCRSFHLGIQGFSVRLWLAYLCITLRPQGLTWIFFAPFTGKITWFYLQLSHG